MTDVTASKHHSQAREQQGTFEHNDACLRPSEWPLAESKVTNAGEEVGI